MQLETYKKTIVMFSWFLIRSISGAYQEHIRKRHEGGSKFEEVVPHIELPVCCVDQVKATHGSLRTQFQICFIHPLILSFIQQFIHQNVIRKFLMLLSQPLDSRRKSVGLPHLSIQRFLEVLNGFLHNFVCFFPNPPPERNFNSSSFRPSSKSSQPLALTQTLSLTIKPSPTLTPPLTLI